MVPAPPPVDPLSVTSTSRSVSSRRRFTVPVDLEAVRLRSEGVVAEVAAAPVRYVPAALLEALQGSWGTPESLGLVDVPQRHLRLVQAS
jgi:hypothetical protein